ncbi:MAG: FCD domain-containing protein [Myxococcota bacterium]
MTGVGQTKGSDTSSPKRKVSERIQSEIEGFILRGGFAPGERLPPERTLAERLNASRPSVREALSRLQAKGIVELRPGGGAYVRDAAASVLTDPLFSLMASNPETEWDFLEFRSMVEGQAAYLAALRATEPDHQLLERRLADVETAVKECAESSVQAQVDAAFHLGVAECAHNAVLLYVMRALVGVLREDVFRNRRKLYEHQGSQEVMRRQHRAIFEAVVAGDPFRAQQKARDHLEYVMEALRNRENEARRRELAALRLERDGT